MLFYISMSYANILYSKITSLIDFYFETYKFYKVMQILLHSFLVWFTKKKFF